jgi:hypothetical protein
MFTPALPPTLIHDSHAQLNTSQQLTEFDSVTGQHFSQRVNPMDPLFSGCSSSPELRFASGTGIKKIHQLKRFRAFITYMDEEDVKHRRRLFQLLSFKATRKFFSFEY